MSSKENNTFYIVKLCKPHSLMIGWSAMDINENVNDLDDWMTNVRDEDTYFKFMKKPPRACAECLKRG